MKKFLILPAISIVCCFASCKTDFDVIGEYKEIAVVYGLLNANDTVQYIRVGKAFLGEGNAYLMAQQPDSIYFSSQLQVYIERWKNGIKLSTINFTPDSSFTKDPGIFAATPNIVYRTTHDPVNHSDSVYEDSEYRLFIYNPSSGETITAATEIVDRMVISKPSPFNSQPIEMSDDDPYKVEFTTGKGGKVFQLTIRFHYNEEVISSGIITPKFIDWVFPLEKVADPNEQVELTIQIIGSQFYGKIATLVEPDNTVIRHAGKLDFIFTGGAEELNTYIEVNQPPLGINQHIPLYTNISDGLGLLSSRVTVQVKNRNLDAAGLDSLFNGAITGHLSFGP